MTPARIAEVYAACGFHVGATARIARLSIPETRRVLQSQGFLRVKGPPRPPVTAKALALFQAGYARHEVQQALGLSCQHISNIMKRKRAVLEAME